MSKDNGSRNIFLSLLTVLFIGLKITHYVDWSWFWVLSPIILPLCFVLVLLLLIGIVTYTTEEKKKQKGAISLIALALITIISGIITLETDRAINEKKIVVYVPKKDLAGQKIKGSRK